MTVQETRVLTGTVRAREEEKERKRNGDKEGKKAERETFTEWWEMMQPIGKLLPRAIVCCVCATIDSSV